MADPTLLTREEIAAAEERHDRDHYACRTRPAIRAKCNEARALAQARAYLDLVERIEALANQWALEATHKPSATADTINRASVLRNRIRELRALLPQKEPTK